MNHRQQQSQVDEDERLLADLVRCTAKMAEALGINLADAYVARADQLAKRWGH